MSTTTCVFPIERERKSVFPSVNTNQPESGSLYRYLDAGPSPKISTQHQSFLSVSIAPVQCAQLSSSIDLQTQKLSRYVSIVLETAGLTEDDRRTDRFVL